MSSNQVTTVVPDQQTLSSGTGAEDHTAGRRDGHRRRELLFFLGPALGFYLAFMMVPLLGTFFLSFTDWPGFSLEQIDWVGLENFRELADDGVFWQAFRHNIFLLVGAIVLNTLLALVLALALDQNLRGSSFFRGVFLMPTVISLVVVALVFGLGLSPSLGFINPALEAVGLGRLAGEWLGDPDRVLPMILLLDTWSSFGLYMFLLIARLIAIPKELREAAAIDGAGELRTIWYVILPLLRNTITMVMLLIAINSLKMFELVYVMTSGGPNHASEVIATWGYFQGFTATRVGYGSATLVVLLVLTFILATIYVRKFRTQDDL
jgi:raffinose/stachyose/melibiose transport system permease protein